MNTLLRGIFLKNYYFFKLLSFKMNNHIFDRYNILLILNYELVFIYRLVKN